MYKWLILQDTLASSARAFPAWTACLVSDGWIQSTAFLHIKESMWGGLLAMHRGCCPRVVRCSFATALSLEALVQLPQLNKNHFCISFFSCSTAFFFFSILTFTQFLKGFQRKKKSLFYDKLVDCSHPSSPKFSYSCWGLASKKTPDSLGGAATQVGGSVLRTQRSSVPRRN